MKAELYVCSGCGLINQMEASKRYTRHNLKCPVCQATQKILVKSAAGQAICQRFNKVTADHAYLA